MRSFLLSCAVLLLTAPLFADDKVAGPAAGRKATESKAAPNTAVGDALLARYFELETARVANESLADIKTLGDWNSRKDEYRRQLFEMLGLDPLPERCAMTRRRG